MSYCLGTYDNEEFECDMQPELWLSLREWMGIFEEKGEPWYWGA